MPLGYTGLSVLSFGIFSLAPDDTDLVWLVYLVVALCVIASIRRLDDTSLRRFNLVALSMSRCGS